jgi:hypothetical protein
MGFFDSFSRDNEDFIWIIIVVVVLLFLLGDRD